MNITILKLHFSTANGARLFTADVMFIYVFTKNDIGLTHRDNTYLWYEHILPQTASYCSMHRS